jgi:hypothetical protein
MTRTNKRIKQGNTRKIKNNNNTTSHTQIFVDYINNTLVYIYIYKHESALLDVPYGAFFINKEFEFVLNFLNYLVFESNSHNTF